MMEISAESQPKTARAPLPTKKRAPIAPISPTILRETQTATPR